MQTYRMYIKNGNVYTMANIEANSFRDAIDLVEPELQEEMTLVSVMRASDVDYPIDDPFLAGMLLEEVTSSLEHLVKTGYDTSHITAVLAAYDGQDSEVH